MLQCFHSDQDLKINQYAAIIHVGQAMQLALFRSAYLKESNQLSLDHL